MHTSTESQDALAILFANLGGSTRPYDTLGDVSAREMTGEYLERMIAEVEAGRGRVVKTIGDELMCAFGDPNCAFDAAIAILRVLENAAPADGIGVHVGFHYGPVVSEKDDVFGDTVNVAARMVRLAEDGEIATTRQVVDRLSPERSAQTRMIDRHSLKGKEEKIEIHTVALRQDVRLTTPDLATFDDSSSTETCSLTLRLGELLITLDRNRPIATIGRQPDCDLVLTDSGASRQHARVELRDGKPYLSDISTNGTALIAERKEPTFLRREEAILQGSGRFGLRSSATGEPVTPIYFEVASEVASEVNGGFSR